MMNLDKKQKISSLSSGMMAKAKIALTLSRASRLIMLDEPLNGIDIIARDEIINIILNNISERSTMLISSHLVDELEKIVDSAVYMKDGSIVTGGDAEDIRTRYGKSLVDIYRDIYGTGGYTNA
jgi:ABC-2 type transport system ATP-binding protein